MQTNPDKKLIGSSYKSSTPRVRAAGGGNRTVGLSADGERRFRCRHPRRSGTSGRMGDRGRSMFSAERQAPSGRYEEGAAIGRAVAPHLPDRQAGPHPVYTQRGYSKMGVGRCVGAAGERGRLGLKQGDTVNGFATRACNAVPSRWVRNTRYQGSLYILSVWIEGEARREARIATMLPKYHRSEVHSRPWQLV